MSNPNIFSSTELYGKSGGASITTTESTLISNSSGSGKILKIFMLQVANTNGGNTAEVTLVLYKNSVAFNLVKSIPVPTDSSIVILSKDNQVYLEENDLLKIYGSASNLDVVYSYEELS
jgi:hypothetical protein